MRYLKYTIFVLFFALPSIASAVDFYWVGGCSTENWSCDDGATTNWSLSDGGAQHTDIPTAADDVFFTVTDASNSTISANITINSLDMNGYVGTLTQNASIVLTIDSFNSANRSLRFSAGMTYTVGNITNTDLTFTSTSGTGTITSAGKAFSRMNFSGTGGTWQLTDALTGSTTGSTLLLTAGTLDTNNQSITVGIFSSSNSNTRTLTLGSSAITLTAINTGCFSASTVTNLTVTANTATSTCSGSGATFTSGAKDWNGLSIAFTGGGTTSLNTPTCTFANITYTGTAVKTDIFEIQGTNTTISSTLTINGNSSINRILVRAQTLGTTRTLTAAAVSVTNADFRDITGAGAGSWDLSAITGLSGDTGGNSGITFTTATTTYWIGGTGNWSDSNEWAWGSGLVAGTGRVPLPQDDVIFDNGSFNGASQVATMDMPRMGKSIDWSGYTEGQTPNWSKTVQATLYGSVTLISGMTTSGTTLAFEGRGAFTITSAGQTFASFLTVSMIGGTLTLQDALTIGATLAINNGTFDANDFNITATTFNGSNTNTRTILLGNGTLTVTSTGANTFQMTTVTNLTFDAQGSTVVVNNTTSTSKTFSGGGLTYNIVTFTGSNITVTGSNTFNTLNLNTAGLIGTKFTTGTTQTITNFNSNGSAGSLVSASSTSATNATWTKAGGGTVCEDYLSLTDITGSPASTWYAANSTDGGDNTNWTFTACPAGAVEATTEIRGQIEINGQLII